jgi:hypothetical protein
MILTILRILFISLMVRSTTRWQVRTVHAAFLHSTLTVW